MRLSADPADRGYLALDLLRRMGVRVHVVLDGVPRRWVETVDDDAGFLCEARMDDRGGVFAAGDQVARRTVVGGNVQIVLKPSI
jgi:hypothetical protein